MNARQYAFIRRRLGKDYSMLRENGLTVLECYDIANDRDITGKLMPKQNFDDSIWQEVFRQRLDKVDKLYKDYEKKGIVPKRKFIDKIINQWTDKGAKVDIWKWFRDAYDKTMKKAKQLKKEHYFD